MELATLTSGALHSRLTKGVTIVASFRTRRPSGRLLRYLPCR